MASRPAPLSELAAADQAIQVIGDASVLIHDVVYDSRDVTPGALFAALLGGDFDGHDFIAEALSRGAAALLVQTPGDLPVPQLVCGDSRRALASVAAQFFRHPSSELSVVGITGTDGKTTTSHLVEALFRHADFETGMIGTVALRVADRVDLHATRQTTPESSETQRFLRQMVDAGVQWAVLEATSHGLDLHRLDHVRFDVAAVTNVTHEHLEHHKTIPAYRRAKAKLFEQTVANGGTCVINVDDEGARAMLAYAADAPIIRYSRLLDSLADLKALNWVSTRTDSRFDLFWRDERAEVRLPLIGEFNISNALCAAGIGIAAGLPLRRIASGLSKTDQIPGRMVQVDQCQPFSVVVDYAHTPAALDTILRLLRSLYPAGRLIVVFGSAGERDATKRPLQGAVAANRADIAIVTSEDPRQEAPERIIADIVTGALAAGAMAGRDLHSVVDRRAAIRLAFSLARPGDCVLLAGKGHEQSMIWGREKRPWDEELIAREELASHGWSAADNR